jgi:hypothetical protein
MERMYSLEEGITVGPLLYTDDNLYTVALERQISYTPYRVCL